MRMALSIHGFDRLMEQLSDLPNVAEASVARTLNFVAQSMAQRAKHRVRSGGRSGRTYLINGVPHQASAPGEPPANLSGALAQSIRYTRITDNIRSGATAGSDLAYAATLEHGGFSTFNGSTVFIMARPFLLPSFEEAILQAETVLRREFERSFK